MFPAGKTNITTLALEEQQLGKPEDVLQLPQLSSQAVALLHQLHVLLLQLPHLGVQLSDPLQLPHPELKQLFHFKSLFLGIRLPDFFKDKISRKRTLGNLK